MKQKIFLLTVVCALSSISSLRASGCTVSTLNGSYAGTVSGASVSGAPLAVQAIAHFDGAGNFSLTGFTEVQSGTVLVSDASASGGTYVVSPDCSGALQIPTAAGTFKFSILITGRQLAQFQMLETDGTATTSGNAVRQEISSGDVRWNEVK